MFFNRKKENRLSIHTVFIAKENILFLKEWLLYHQTIGFEKFYLYDNSTVKYGDDNESEKSNIKFFKAGKISKYGIDYENLIKLDNEEINSLLHDIINDFDGDVELIKWSPKNQEGVTVYGHVKSLYDFKKKFSSKNDWVAFIDIDEFIISPSGLKLQEFLNECDENKIRLVRIFQKKFQCRYSNLDKNVIDIYDCIENIDTTFGHGRGSWGEKLIVKMNYLKDIDNIHKMKIKRGKEIDMDINELRFNHYNVNDKLIVWMKEWFGKKDFQYSLDDSIKLNRPKIDYNQNHCSLEWRNSLINDR